MILQNFLFPHSTFNAPAEMYIRFYKEKDYSFLPIHSNSYSWFNGTAVVFQKNSRCWFDTFYNGLTVHTYKKYTSIDNLQVVLNGKGNFILRIGLYINNLNKTEEEIKKRNILNNLDNIEHIWLEEYSIVLQDGKINTIDITSWKNIDKGILYICLEAITDNAELYSGYFSTQALPQENVKLAIVITHFNRKQFVLPAIQRISQDLLSNIFYKDKIELIVVDNSSNIDSQEVGGITLLPNKNLGGSGGFTRGLLYAKDNNFTHCLFMDDDASCEIESIKRTYILLSYSIIENMSIAGSLLEEMFPYLMFEKGAQYNIFCHPLKKGFDMRFVSHLLYTESHTILEHEKPNYGAWWFYTFKISDITRYPFPFFVRGDDIAFSLANDFNIITMNGINCWGESFDYKTSGFLLYLDCRSHLVNAILYSKTSFLALIGCLKIIYKFTLSQLFSYNYGSAKAILKAVQHVLQGSNFFVENIDMVDVRNTINSYIQNEKLTPMDITQYQYNKKDSLSESKLRFIIRLITLNGFLLPKFMIHQKIILQKKGVRATLRHTFLYQSILYYSKENKIGYMASYNKNKFFGQLFSLILTLIQFTIKFNWLNKNYKKNISNIASESFWRTIYPSK